MKRLFHYAFAAFAAYAIAACGDSHEAHEHSHEGHSHSHEQHTHDAHNHSHSHEHEHPHSHEAGNHSHDAHEHGHAHEHEHEHTTGNEVAGNNIITFGKEQQKMIDFAIVPVLPSNFNGAVKVAARVSATPNNATTVVATNAGRVHYAGNLVAGKDIIKGEALFALDGSDVTENDAAVKFAEAESSYLVAKADYERKAALHKENIVSEKELQSAEAALHSSEAHYNSMKRSFNNGKMVLKAPISGYVASLPVANGEYVAAGTPLAHLQRDGEVNIEGELPIRFAQMLKNITSVNIELGNGKVISLEEANGHIVAVGRAANSCNMLPVTVSAKNLDAVPGSIVTLHLVSSLEEGKQRLTVPRSALVEEMGNFFVFVDKGGDRFEKREVQIGATDGRNTQILKGLYNGERVVSSGAISLKLSQGAAAIDPHAGHVH